MFCSAYAARMAIQERSGKPLFEILEAFARSRQDKMLPACGARHVQLFRNCHEEPERDEIDVHGWIASQRLL